MKLSKEGILLSVLLAGAAFLPLTGCSSGGSSTPAAATNADGETLSSLTSGYTVPTTVSAVPASTTSTAASFTTFSRAVAALAATTDYQRATPSKYIEEPVLDQFGIIEDVLAAITQTKYNDPVNINKGPYKSMVSFPDEKNGQEVKKLEPWIVDSRMIVLAGVDVNRVLCWIDEGGKVIKAEFKVYSPATFDAAGEITSYGKWELNVKFNDAGTNFFVASATPNRAGGTIIKVNEYEYEGPGEVHQMKGVLYRDNSSGYGKMAYTDYDSCQEWPCTPTVSTAKYAYNSGYLGTAKGSSAPVYKDRATGVEMTHQYGLYYNESPVTSTDSSGKAIAAGDDVRKHKQFGFPLVYTDSGGNQSHAYYGAWQGRHQLWGGGESAIPAGTTVTKESWGAGEPVTYTVAATLNGSFTKRNLVSAALADIEGVPVETWVDKQFSLTWDAASGKWVYCKGYVDGSTCKSPDGATLSFVEFTSFNELLVLSAEDRKWVNVNRWTGSANIDYVYMTAAVDAALAAAMPGYTSVYGADGFYPATRDSSTNLMIPSGPIYTPSNLDNLWVSIGGSIYIAHAPTSSAGSTTGWVQKKVTEFNTRSWQPVFDDTADISFAPQIGREYYMNASGVNYVVKRVADSSGFVAGDYEVKLETQTTANPKNCTSSDCTAIVPAGTAYFRTPWNPTVSFSLNPTTLLLHYRADDPNTQNVVETTATVATSGMWGLQAFNTLNQPLKADGTAVAVDQWGFPSGAERPTEFNWEYCDPSQGQCWGAQTYLKDIGNSYVILDDPVALAAITVKNGEGTDKTLMLQYDGWMHGLPNLYDTLRENNWQITTDIKNKVVNIAAGTPVTDGTDTYYLKPLGTSIFLETVSAAVITAAGGSIPDLTRADGINLATDVPSFTSFRIADTPTGLTVKYSEGVLVE